MKKKITLTTQCREPFESYLQDAIRQDGGDLELSVIVVESPYDHRIGCLAQIHRTAQRRAVRAQNDHKATYAVSIEQGVVHADGEASRFLTIVVVMTPERQECTLVLDVSMPADVFKGINPKETTLLQAIRKNIPTVVGVDPDDLIAVLTGGKQTGWSMLVPILAAALAFIKTSA